MNVQQIAEHLYQSEKNVPEAGRQHIRCLLSPVDNLPKSDFKGVTDAEWEEALRLFSTMRVNRFVELWRNGNQQALQIPIYNMDSECPVRISSTIVNFPRVSRDKTNSLEPMITEITEQEWRHICMLMGKLGIKP